MRFAHPWALALVALAAPVVVAYLFRLHNQRRPVASTILLRVLRDPQPAARRARARLRHRLSLALVAAALALAVLALARPTLGGRGPRRIIAVLDTSASMAATDGGARRLGRAVDELARLADGLGPDDRLALVTTGPHAVVEVPPTTSHADVVLRARALAAAGAAGDNGGDELAARLADALCPDPAHAEVVILSDGAGLALPPTRCPRRLRPVGGQADNVGVSALSVRLVDGLGAHDVHVAVSSSARQARTVQLTLAADEQVLEVLSLELAPGATVTRDLRVMIEGGARLVASVAPSGGDVLDDDDRASVALPDAGPVAVLLVTSHPRSLVAEALRVHPRARLAVAAPGALPPGPFDLVLLEDEPRTALPPAGHVVGLGVAPAGAPLGLGAAAAERGVVRWDFDAAWFRYVDLRDLYLTSARLVTGGRPIVDSASGPLAAHARWDDRELLVTGFAVGDSDLGLRAAFPNLIADLVDWSAPAAPPRPPPEGVLSAGESLLTAATVDEASPAGGGAGGGGRGLFTLAVLAALALVLAEQAYTLTRRPRRAT